MAELTIKFPQLTKRRLLIIGVGIVIIIMLAGAARLYVGSGPGIRAVVGPVSGFTPYFFRRGKPPDGYAINKAQSLFVDNVVQIMLDKPGVPSLVLTEQALPAQLSAQTLLASGSQIRGAAGPATIASVDEHVVGTLLPSAHATLVLITGPQNASSNDVTDLIKALRPSS